MALYTVANLQSCTICRNLGDKRESGRITVINWERICENVEARCAEDAVALYTDKTLHAGKVRRLCDVCRLVVCRGLDMKLNTVADVSHPFDIGRSKRAVRRTIAWIRDRLPTRTASNQRDLMTHVIFLSEIFIRYNEFVIGTG